MPATRRNALELAERAVCLVLEVVTVYRTTSVRLRSARSRDLAKVEGPNRGIPRSGGSIRSHTRKLPLIRPTALSRSHRKKFLAHLSSAPCFIRPLSETTPRTERRKPK